MSSDGFPQYRGDYAGIGGVHQVVAPRLMAPEGSVVSEDAG
jgi:hypothetical protein